MKKQLIRKQFSLILALCMLFCMTACAQPAAEEAPAQSTEQAETPAQTGEDTVKIGLVYPMTGTQAQAGIDYVKTLELCADIVNNSWTDINLPYAETEGIPGLGGAKVEFVVADTQGDPQIAMSAAERLITEDGVDLLMGAYTSACTKTASNVAERLGVPFVCPGSTSTELTERGYEYFFRTGPNESTFIDDSFKFLDYANAELGADIKTVAFVTEDTDMGSYGLVEMQKYAPLYGYEVVETIVYSASATNLTSEVLRLKEANPDAILQISLVSDTTLFINTFKEYDFMPKAILGQRAGFVSVEFLNAVGNDAEYLFSSNVWALDMQAVNPLIGQFNDLFKERSGNDLTGDYAREVAGFFCVVDALDRAGTTDPEAVKQALVETDITYDGDMIVPWEGIKFDENNQNVRVATTMTQVLDGVYTTVWPLSGQAKAPVIPVPGWDER